MNAPAARNPDPAWGDGFAGGSRPAVIASAPPQQAVDGGADAVMAGLTAHIDRLHDDIVTWRRDIHRHPELGWQEQRTTDLVGEILTDAGLSPRRLDPTGVVVDIGAAPGEAAVRVGLRADMDALPVPERTGLSFASTEPGVCHACGHDVHTACLLGAGVALAAGSEALAAEGIMARLIFQPAEEQMPGGGRRLYEAGETEGLHRLFALHCDPRRDVGEIATRKGPITAASDTVVVRVRGTGGHTSRPHLTQDVTYALAKVATDVPAALSRRLDPRVGAALVWGSMHAGHVPNVIPEEGILSGTLRLLDGAAWLEVQPLLARLVEAVVSPYGVSVEVEHLQGVPPVVNHPSAVDAVKRAGRLVVGRSQVRTAEQSLGGEDFAWLLTGGKGALTRLGTRTPGGPTYDLHQGDLQIDERALAHGAKLMAALPVAARQVLDREE